MQQKKDKTTPPTPTITAPRGVLCGACGQACGGDRVYVYAGEPPRYIHVNTPLCLVLAAGERERGNRLAHERQHEGA